MTSIDRFFGRWLKRLDGLVKMVTQNFGHLVVKTQTRRDEGSSAERPVIGYPDAVGSQDCNVNRPHVVRENKAIYYDFAPVSQVYENIRFGRLSHLYSLQHVSIYNQPLREPESTGGEE